MNTNDTLTKYNIKIDSASFSLVQFKMLHGPTLGAKNVYTVYGNAVPQVH